MGVHATGQHSQGQLEEVASGTPLQDLRQLASAVARLYFVPVVERIVEGDHSIVHRHGGYRKVSAAYVSCSQRLPEIDIIMSSPDDKAKPLAAFEHTRKLRKCSKLFKFTKHPQWHDITCKPKKQQAGLEKLAARILYSADVSTQYFNLGPVRARHDAEKRARRKVEDALVNRKVKISREAVLNSALVTAIFAMC